MLKCLAIGSLLFSACTLMHADVTIRQSFDFKMNMPIPGAQAPQLPFHELWMRVKGDRAYTETGTINSITDAATGQVTMLDPKTNRYATSSMADYMAALQQSVALNGMPEQAKAILSQIKVDVDSHDTGRTERIQGVDAAEREIVMTMTIPIPMPGLENGMHILVKMRVWKPTGEAAGKIPWVREMTSYYSRAMDLNNPFNMIRQMFTAIPGFGDSMEKMVKEMSKGGGVTLRMHIEVLMPDLAGIMAQAKAKGAEVPDMPAADSPLLEVDSEIKEVNTEPIPDALLQIPAGYKKAAMEDIVKAMVPTAPKQ